jgi:hypothetical protein
LPLGGGLYDQEESVMVCMDVISSEVAAYQREEREAEEAKQKARTQSKRGRRGS